MVISYGEGIQTRIKIYITFIYLHLVDHHLRLDALILARDQRDNDDLKKKNTRNTMKVSISIILYFKRIIVLSHLIVVRVGRCEFVILRERDAWTRMRVVLFLSVLFFSHEEVIKYMQLF